MNYNKLDRSNDDLHEEVSELKHDLSSVADEIKSLKATVKEQQAQIAELQKQLEQRAAAVSATVENGGAEDLLRRVQRCLAARERDLLPPDSARAGEGADALPRRVRAPASPPREATAKLPRGVCCSLARLGGPALGLLLSRRFALFAQ